MRLPNVEIATLLATVTAGAGAIDFGPGPTRSSPAAGTSPRPTPPIQARALDPHQVVPVPVAIDRLTTVRFPSPISDLVSALVSTEPHPEALFVVIFQPGEAFFSVRALRPNATTSLNVVWRAQTHVFELTASPNPVLSLILTNPPPARVSSPPKPTQPPPSPDAAAPANPWRRYESVAKDEPSLRRLFPRGMQGFQRETLGHSEETTLYGVRLEDLLAFPAEAVAVVRMTVSNRTPAVLQPSALDVDLASGGKTVRVLHLDRPNPIPAFGSQTWFATIALPPTPSPEVFARGLCTRVHFPPAASTPSAHRRP